MVMTAGKRPRSGALSVAGIGLGFLLGASSAPIAMAQPLSRVTPVQAGSTTDQLRVYSVADQLIGYLAKAVDWVDRPDTRLPVNALAPKIKAVVLAHPEVRLVDEQRETAAQSTREAYAGFLPQVSTNVEAGKRSNDAVRTPWSSVPAYEDNSKAVSITGRQLLYDFGAVSNQVDARTSLEAAVAARLGVRRSELALRALTAWLELFRGQQILAVSRMNVLSRQQIMAFIDEREQLGASSQSEVLRARARLADAQVTAVVAQNRLTAAEAVYREMFNEAPPAQLALPASVGIDQAKYANLGELLQDSPLLAESRAQTEAAGLEAKSASAALLPSFHLEISARRRDLDSSGVPGLDWNAGVMVRQNLYSGGADVARKRQADQKAKESQLAEDNVKRQLERSMAQALADVSNSAAAIGARKEAVVVAGLALGAVREQFAFRRGTLLDLLRSQEELYLAGRDLIDGVVDHALVRYRLLHITMELNPMFELSAAKE
jgi:adhesin transport system outer membrane protein